MDSSKYFYIIRNAEAKSNKEKCFCRSSPLTLNGIQQANLVAAYLSNKNISCIYSSPLEHALQTAIIINQRLGTKLIIKSNLANIKTGDWEGMNVNNISTKWRVEWNKLITGKIMEHEMIVPNGEYLISFYSRIKDCFEEINNIAESNNSYCIVSHNLAIGALLAYILKADSSALFSFEQYNACINLIKIEPNIRKIIFSNYFQFIEKNGLSICEGALSGAPVKSND